MSEAAGSFYTYFHARNDTGAVFYVGKGRADRSHQHKGRNPHWRNIVKKHGHTVHIAAHWPTEKDAFNHEKFLILCFKDMELKLANMTSGGEGISGLTHTPEAKAKISAASKLHMQSDAARENIRKWSTGRFHSASTRLKISLAHMGKTGPSPTEETRAKLRAANVGKKLTADHKAKIGKAHAGKTIPQEMRERISKALKGRPLAPEARANVVAALFGRIPSEATKEKLRIAALAQWKRAKDRGDSILC